MILGALIRQERKRLKAAVDSLQLEKQKAQALIAEINPAIASAQQALDDFDADVALIPARIKDVVL